jgi:hypothetical protein
MSWPLAEARDLVVGTQRMDDRARDVVNASATPTRTNDGTLW